MKTKLCCKIIVLWIFLALGGCAGTSAQPTAGAAGTPILSAEQARSMIRVTMTALPPAKDPETVVAANVVE